MREWGRYSIGKHTKIRIIEILAAVESKLFFYHKVIKVKHQVKKKHLFLEIDKLIEKFKQKC